MKSWSHAYGPDLGKINQAARTGADLVQSLLTFSRKMETKPRPLNLNHQIERVRKLLSRTVPKMIEIQLDLCGNLPSINADPTQVEQSSLISRLMPEMLCRMEANSSSRPTLPRLMRIIVRGIWDPIPGDYVVLQFSDTGQGMDRDTWSIFSSRFIQQRVLRGNRTGARYGLRDCEQHGGYITCDSEQGRGSTFKIFFPVELSHAERQRELLKPTLGGGTETILLVDDEVFVRDLGERILKRVGYTVITAANGKEALKRFAGQRNEIDLVVLDLHHAGNGGKQLSRRNPEDPPSHQGVDCERLFRLRTRERIRRSKGQGLHY